MINNKFRKILETFRDSNHIKNHIETGKPLNSENTCDFNNSKLESILFDYYKLSALEELSELEAKHLDKILELAETDETLSLMLNEVDELTFEELGFYEKDSLEQVENQIAKVKEFIINSESMQSISDYQDILTEYYKLTTLEELSELDAKRLEKILERAETDGTLSLMLNEVDELTFEELGFYKKDSLEKVENQKAKASKDASFARTGAGADAGGGAGAGAGVGAGAGAVAVAIVGGGAVAVVGAGAITVAKSNNIIGMLAKNFPINSNSQSSNIESTDSTASNIEPIYSTAISSLSYSPILLYGGVAVTIIIALTYCTQVLLKSITKLVTANRKNK